MALFFGNRDAQFVNRINRELIIDIIDVEVDFYKLVLDDTTHNVFDESEERRYYEPTVVACLVNRDPQSWVNVEVGDDVVQGIRFGLFRDVLKDMNLVPETGDIIGWDSDLYQIDAIEENEYFGGKNEDTWNRGAGNFGLNVSLIAVGHKTRDSLTDLKIVRSGINPNEIVKRSGDYK